MSHPGTLHRKYKKAKSGQRFQIRKTESPRNRGVWRHSQTLLHECHQVLTRRVGAGQESPSLPPDLCWGRCAGADWMPLTDRQNTVFTSQDPSFETKEL